MHFPLTTNWFSTCNRFKAKPVGSLPLQVFPSSAGKTSCTHLGMVMGMGMGMQYLLRQITQETKLGNRLGEFFFLSSFLYSHSRLNRRRESSGAMERECALILEKVTSAKRHLRQPVSQPIVQLECYIALLASAPHFHSISAEESRWGESQFGVATPLFLFLAEHCHCHCPPMTNYPAGNLLTGPVCGVRQRKGKKTPWEQVLFVHLFY